jgi:hypothetical protein
VVPAASGGGPNITTNNLLIAAGGPFEIVWELTIDSASADANDDASIVTVDAVVDGSVVTKEVAPRGEDHARLSLPFAVKPNQAFGSRLWYRGRGNLIVTGATIHRAP